jgi:hypothetical protein
MEFLALLIAVAGLLWGLLLLKRGGLLAGCLAVMLAGVCFSVDFFKLSGPMPLTIDRLLMVVLVGQYFIWRKFGMANPKPLGKPEIVLCLLTAVMVVSTFSSDFTQANNQPVAWLIIYYLMPFGIYWIARQTPLSERSVLALFISLTVFGVYLAVTSLAERYELSGLVFPRYIIDTAASATAEFVGRARGPFLNPVGNGIALSICLAASLMLWPNVGQIFNLSKKHILVPTFPRENAIPRRSGVADVSTSLETGGNFLYTRLAQLSLLPIFLLFAAAIYVTLTRSVWMGGALTLALIVGLSLPWNWRMPLLVGGLLLAVVFSVSQWDQLLAFKRDKNLDADKVAESVELRPVLARIAWNMFLDRPLFGCGYAQYTKEHINYLSDRSSELVLEKGRAYIQHNVVLSLLTETGLLGLGLFLTLCTLWAIDAWRLWQSPTAPLLYRQMGLLLLVMLSVYFLNGMFHDVSVISMMNMTLFFLAGTTAALRPEISKNEICTVGSTHQNAISYEEETPVLRKASLFHD